MELASISRHRLFKRQNTHKIQFHKYINNLNHYVQFTPSGGWTPAYFKSDSKINLRSWFIKFANIQIMSSGGKNARQEDKNAPQLCIINQANSQISAELEFETKQGHRKSNIQVFSM